MSYKPIISACLSFSLMFSQECSASTAEETVANWHLVLSKTKRDASTERLSDEKCIEEVLLLFGTGDFSKAKARAANALGLAKDDQQKAGLYFVIAQSHAALGEYSQAHKAVLEGQRLVKHSTPQAYILACGRLTYANRLKDELLIEAAKDFFRDNTSDEKIPTCDPVTGLVIVSLASLLVTTYIAKQVIDSTRDLPPKDRVQIINSLCKNFFPAILSISENKL